MTCISRPPRSLQGASSDEALVGLPPGLRVPGTTPRARDSLPMPQEDTDDAVTPPTAVSDCLGARAAKNRQQLKTGKGCIGQGVQIPLLAFF